MTCMATYVPMKVEEPRHAAGAPTSIPAPIRVLTIITLVVVLALFGMVVATMALISEIVSADKSDFYLSDYEIAELDYVSSLAEGFSAFPLVAAVVRITSNFPGYVRDPETCCLFVDRYACVPSDVVRGNDVELQREDEGKSLPIK